MDNVVECNKCEKRFVLRHDSLKKVEKQQGELLVDLTYFKCEHCEAVYPVLWTDNKLREMREQYKTESHYIKKIIERGEEVTPQRTQRLDTLFNNINKRALDLAKFYHNKIPDYTRQD